MRDFVVVAVILGLWPKFPVRESLNFVKLAFILKCHENETDSSHAFSFSVLSFFFRMLRF